MSNNELEAYLNSLTLDEGKAHNSAHEALLMNGYEFLFCPCEIEDSGDAESGPMITGHAAYCQYRSDWEYVFTERGLVVHREPRNLEFEAWLDTQEREQLPAA